MALVNGWSSAATYIYHAVLERQDIDGLFSLCIDPSSKSYSKLHPLAQTGWTFAINSLMSATRVLREVEYKDHEELFPDDQSGLASTSTAIVPVNCSVSTVPIDVTEATVVNNIDIRVWQQATRWSRCHTHRQAQPLSKPQDGCSNYCVKRPWASVRKKGALGTLDLKLDFPTTKAFRIPINRRV